MAELVGLAIGALFWPWMFTGFFRAVGLQPSSALWVGYIASVGAGVAVASATGFPLEKVILFAGFALGFTVWRAPRKATATVAASRPEIDDSDEGI